MPSSRSWNNLHDSYALYPLAVSEKLQSAEINSVNLKGDRRPWLYENPKLYQRILLVGFTADEVKSKTFEYTVIDENHLLIKNNNLIAKPLFERLYVGVVQAHK